MSPAAALVTGASTGIGRATALYLDARGWRVFAGVRREPDASALREAGSERLRPLRLDVTDADAIEAARAEVESALAGDGLAGLVNNAGVAVGGLLEFLDLDSLRIQLEVNVVGVAAVTRAFLPLLRRGGGRVVNIGSNSGYIAAPFVAPYCASKFAVEALTDSLRRELRSWGLHACVVQPGSIATPIWDKGRAQQEQLLASLPEEARKLYAEVLPTIDRFLEESAGRGIPPEHVARAVHRALSARRPRTRYRVGSDAHVLFWLSRLLPGRAMDAVLARFGGL